MACMKNTWLPCVESWGPDWYGHLIAFDSLIGALANFPPTPQAVTQVSFERLLDAECISHGARKSVRRKALQSCRDLEPCRRL